MENLHCCVLQGILEQIDKDAIKRGALKSKVRVTYDGHLLDCRLVRSMRKVGGVVFLHNVQAAEVDHMPLVSGDCRTTQLCKHSICPLGMVVLSRNRDCLVLVMPHLVSIPQLHPQVSSWSFGWYCAF